MKFTHCLLATATFVSALNFAEIDEVRLPHAVKISRRAVPAGIPAEITGVVDSNTRPIEDGDSLTPSKPAGSAIVPLSSVDGTSPGAYKGVPKAVGTNDATSDSENNNNNAFFMSISMIIVSEIGDKTFLISALMAMRHPRIVVFTASFASLAIMTLLSGIVGHTLPTLLSQRVTQFLAALLFLVFGYRLTREGLAMSKDLGVEEELAEVEEELTVSDMNNEMHNAETGGQPKNRAGPSSLKGQFQEALATTLSTLKELSSFVLSPLWVQVFIMVFLGEWGDRSQIATIAMAAGSNYWLVIMGAVIGHGICTAGAVIGGKMLASRISMRTVTLGGAFAFFVFSILYFYDCIYNIED